MPTARRSFERNSPDVRRLCFTFFHLSRELSDPPCNFQGEMALPSEQVTLLSNVETVAEELDQEQDLTIYPSVNTRLANLRPSKDLLDYYRKKISQYDAEFEELCKKLDSFKSGFQEQESLNCEIRQREEEICQLQKALSDMQVYLFQEREQVRNKFCGLAQFI